MPARSKKRLERLKSHREKKKKEKRVRSNPKVFLYIFLSILLVFLFFVFKNSSRYWDGESRLSVATQDDEGDVNVIVFDPKLDEITNIVIPANTYIKAANQMGKWQIKSLWKLGEDEGLEGNLLTKSLTNHASFPVLTWSENTILSLLNRKIASVLQFVFLNTKTNLTQIDRLRMSLFALGVSNAHIKTIDLRETTYLRKATLPDGSDGFVFAGSVPQSLAIYFADERVSKGKASIVVVDNSGEIGLAQSFGKAMEVLGVKVGSIEKREEEDYNCIIKGIDKIFINYLSQLYGCKVNETEDLGGFDIEIKIGKEFAKTF